MMTVRAVAALALWLGAAPTAAAAPAASTLPIEDRARLVTDTAAVLSGVVNPNGSPTAYTFQYGRTRAYGRDTPVGAAGGGIADVPVDVRVEDLAPGTTYHYRLVAFPDPARYEYGVERTAGVDRMFRTFPALRVSFAKRRARVAAGTARVALTAVGPPDALARGRLVLRRRGGGRAGSGAYRIRAGAERVVGVRLRRAARRALARNGRLVVRAAAGPARARIVLRSPRRRRG